MGHSYGGPANDVSGPNGAHDLGSTLRWGPDQKLNSELAQETGASYVRLWALWPKLQLAPGWPPNTQEHVDPVYPGTTQRQYWQMLDRQIETARGIGMRVILTIWLNVYWGPPGTQGGEHWPVDVSTSGDWASFVGFLLDRYTRGNHPDHPDLWIDFLELVNEPNYQLPQRDGSGALISHIKTAEMFKTAGAIRKPGQPKLAGPATAQVGDAPPPPTDPQGGTTNHGTFTALVISRLREIGFQEDGNFVWTHHNYDDIENPDPAGNTSAGIVLLFLAAYGWRGWADRAVSCDAHLMLTEGGCRLNPQTDRTEQLVKVYNNYQHMRALDGVAMHANYLLYSVPFFNCGLLDPIGSGFNGTPRPVHIGDGTLPSRAWSAQTPYSGGE